MSRQIKINIASALLYSCSILGIYFFYKALENRTASGAALIFPPVVIGLTAALAREYYRTQDKTETDRNKIETEILANLARYKDKDHNL